MRTHPAWILVAVAIMVNLLPIMADALPPLDVAPLPAVMERGVGEYAIDASARIHACEGAMAEAEWLADLLAAPLCARPMVAASA